MSAQGVYEGGKRPRCSWSRYTRLSPGTDWVRRVGRTAMPRISKPFDRIDTDNKGSSILDQIVSFVVSR